MKRSEIMASLVTLEVHYPYNWACEGTADLLYCDAATGEKSYGSISQGSSKQQETYPGHQWSIREMRSRQLLSSIIAREQNDGGPQVVMIGEEHRGRDPLQDAVWQMGRAQREPLLKAVELLLKLLGNVLSDPAEAKFRAIRPGNERIRSALDVPGVLALLSCSGWEQSYVHGEAKLLLPEGRPLAPLEGALAQLRRLDALMKGLPVPGEAAGSQDGGGAAATTTQAVAEEASHRCAACGKGIENDLRRRLAGNTEVGAWRTNPWGGGGEYRFHCPRCNQDLCSACYDVWKLQQQGHASGVLDISDASTSSAGQPSGSADTPRAPVHPLTCTLTIEAPITNSWGGSSYGPGRPPPPVNRRNRRGPWG